MTAATPAGPLSGLRVLDLSSYLAGPYGCALLADFGADVVKVEPPNGDMMRHYPSSLDGGSRTFIGANKSKRSIVLDLKQPDALAVLYALVETADILVHNFRPSVPERLGISYERLREIRPEIIYCSITGFGETGPMKDNAGFDQVLQAMSGLAAYQLDRDGRPQLVRGSVVDFFTSTLVAYAVAGAVVHRLRTGEGQHVACSLLRTALAMQPGRFVWAAAEGREADRDLRPGGLTGLHPTRDGVLYISAHTPHFWAALCELTGLDDLAADPRYDTMKKRAARAGELLPLLHAALKARTAEEWEALFGQRVPCSVVRPIEDMFDHPQVAAERMVAEVASAEIGGYRTIARAAVLAGSPGPAPFGAPALGEHTDAILAELGYSAERIAALRAAGGVA